MVNAIRREERDKDSLLKLNYEHHLWGGKRNKNVTNITRKDTHDFLPLAAQIAILPRVEEFSLEES